ncbi:hypothetical protein L211DRAFT_832802 [Terfezia boudieri ATCC MYA-4762]|uniref:Uncharacterized protein n=1 Tax=Terfezia boudieri ATCC MYA-4762 TaxID=1051890 RepID=A0A3N4ML45_9PEZI|nr:hypothetical protein L211DRAFT_832802 [Terfezia boudieri ATCC MYA-4762]
MASHSNHSTSLVCLASICGTFDLVSTPYNQELLHVREAKESLIAVSTGGAACGARGWAQALKAFLVLKTP